MITREQAGRLLGLALLAAVILGVPYFMMAFIMTDFNPVEWGIVARSIAGGMSIGLTAAYLVARLPADEPAQVPRYDSQTGAPLYDQ